MAATTNDSCFWEGLMAVQNIKDVDGLNYLIGFIITLTGYWISSTIVESSELFKIGSYRNLANYILAATLRRSIPGLIYLLLPYIHVIYSWQDFSFITCDFFGFWETFFAVFELESYTMVCVERYVQAKYVSKGWEIPPYHYYLYPILCGFFSFMYAFPPLVGIGRYAKDFNCHHCTFDMILPEVAWKRILVVTIFFMRSIKPAIMMLVMIYWARRLEPHIRDYEIHQNLTRGVRTAMCIILMCGLPITLVRGTVVMSQLIYDKVIVHPDLTVGLAIFAHWLAPLPAMMILLFYDTFLRDITLNFLDRADPEDVAPTITREVSTEKLADNNENDNGNNDHVKMD